MTMLVGGGSGGGAGAGTVQYEPLVEHAVSQTILRVPASVTREELRSAGLTALAAAGRDHDPGSDGDFQHYARARIRAALVDALRSIDWRARGRRPLTPADPDRVDRVREALATLPEDHRTVVEGYFLRQREVTELAAELEVDEHEVARLRTGALRALSRALGPAVTAESQSPWSWSSDSSGTGSPRILNRR